MQSTYLKAQIIHLKNFDMSDSPSGLGMLIFETNGRSAKIFFHGFVKFFAIGCSSYLYRSGG